MESFLNRYRNITVLLLVIFAQLVLLALQVKNDQDVRFIRVWAVTAVTPAARIVEWFRGGSIGFVRHYILLHDASEENRKLRDEVGRLRLQNNFLTNQLNTADRAKALQLFQARTESKMLAANVIGAGAGGIDAKVVFVNRGSAEGVLRGMAVVTPDGIVGKVIAAYPTASEVLLVTDPEFAAGVVSQKSQARGTLKGQGKPLCKVEHVPFEDKVEPGEWFYTSGDDRVFPRGFAVGIVKAVKPGSPDQEITVEPSGLQHGVEDVLIILESVHQAIPEAPPANQPVYIAPPPPATQSPAPLIPNPDNPAAQPTTAAPASGTEADKLRSIYKSVGEAQKHNYGEGPPGTKPPDFTKLPSSPLPPGAAMESAPPKSNTPAGAPATRQSVPGVAGPPNSAPSTGRGGAGPTAGTPAGGSPRVSPSASQSGAPATAPSGATSPNAGRAGTQAPAGGAPPPKSIAPATPGRAGQPTPGTTAGGTPRVSPPPAKSAAPPPPATGEPARVPPPAPKSNPPAKGAPGGPLPE